MTHLVYMLPVCLFKLLLLSILLSGSAHLLPHLLCAGCILLLVTVFKQMSPFTVTKPNPKSRLWKSHKFGAEREIVKGGNRLLSRMHDILAWNC